jgi:ribosome maturation factor RimP
MIKKEKVKDLTYKALGEKEFLVDITISKSNQIKVFVDGFESFTIDNCQRISRFLESELDRDKEDFELVVSTPGLDKPFKVTEQYKKYIGKKVDLLLDTGHKLTADITEATDNEISITYKKNKKEIQETLEYEEINKAKPHISFK